MNKLEKTIQKTNQRSTTLRAIWALSTVCLLLVVGITTVLSSSNQSQSSTPIIAWSTTTPLTKALAGKNAIAYDADNDGQDDFIVFAGGRDANGAPVTDVYSAEINEAGTLSDWVSVTSLPERLFLHSLNIVDSYLYVIGGWKGSEPTQQQVYRAEIRSNGTLGNWLPSGLYKTKVSQHGSAVVTVTQAGSTTSYLYGIGGWEGSFVYDQVNFAPINSDGSITTASWTATTALPQPLRRIAVQAFNGRIYVTGGVNNLGVPSKKVYVGTVNPDGSVEGWQEVTDLPKEMLYHQAVIHDGKLVVLGGKSVNNGPDLQDVYAASIEADGTLGAWVAQPSLPTGLFRFAAVTAKRYGEDYIFVMGGGTGLNASPTVKAEVYYSDVPPTPTPTSSPTPTATPTPPVSMEVEVSNDPGHWVAPGEEITYTIQYTNNGPGSASDTKIEGQIPANTEFIDGSGIPAQSNLSGNTAGSTISWDLSSLAPNSSGTIQYKVRRLEPELPQRGAIEVKLLGPPVGTASQTLTYTVDITNHVSALGLTTVDVQLPSEATYLSSSNGGVLQSNNSIFWTAAGLPEGSWSVDFAVSAERSFVIHEYEVRAQLTGSDSVVCCGVGQEVLVTQIDGEPVIGTGDGVTIINDDVEISWMYNGVGSATAAAGVQNPRPATNRLFLPLTTDGSNAPSQ